jgi:hypothetical protein
MSYYVEVEWGENGVGEIVRQSGLEEIYYADLKTMRVLGHWEQSFVRVSRQPRRTRQESSNSSQIVAQWLGQSLD